MDGEGGIHGEGEFGDVLQHLHHALLLREKVVEGLGKHQRLEFVEQILGRGGGGWRGGGEGGRREDEFRFAGSNS